MAPRAAWRTLELLWVLGVCIHGESKCLLSARPITRQDVAEKRVQLQLLSHVWPLFALKALRYNDSSRTFMSPLLFPSLLLLLPSLPWEVFYKVFIRGWVWWDFERKNWNQWEEKPAECIDWNPWSGKLCGSVTQQKTTQANDTSTAFWPRQNLHSSFTQTLYS